ncbi:2-aminoethylphosphonate aminotransferase [Moorena producens]|uniref:2-aminoethylphosphonate aminotransferase n=1 Tax=Moorena producens TaxID=1155739 RepID=UPI003C74C2D0
MNRTILLNPGPVTLSDRVRRALLQPDLCHREPEFAELALDIKARLAKVYPSAAEDYDAILLTGSGTCAVEAMLSTLVPQDGKALVVTNGVYGERMAAMIKAHGKSLEVVTAPWHEPMNLKEVETCLTQDSAITHVIAVHHETTTGRLNDVAQLGQLCQGYNVALLLDSVSSFGAEAIEFAPWNLEACAATANKCLHGVPGLSFVLVKRSIFEARPSAAGSVYLDLYPYQQDQARGYSPFTQAVQVAYGLQEALKEMEDMGGQTARHSSYTQRAQQILQSLQNLEIKPLLDVEDYSCVLTSFKLPPGYSYEQIHDTLKESGFVIYAGQGGLKNQIFRIANMGDIQPSDLDRLLDCFHALFKHSG